MSDKPDAREIERRLRLVAKIFDRLADLAEKRAKLLKSVEQLMPFVLERARKKAAWGAKPGHC